MVIVHVSMVLSPATLKIRPLKGTSIGAMFDAGIIDPKKVTRVALENAASVSGMILTTECALVDIKEDAPAAGMPPMGGGMPGMM